jgi:hypothetical protein
MCPIEFWNFFKNNLLPTLFASLTQKYWRAYLHSRICVHHRYIHNSHISIIMVYIDVHNFIPEYASTASITTVMTMPFHVKSFGKKFLKKWFSPQISSKPLSPQGTEHKKKRETERKRKKEEEKEKLQESLQIKGSQYFVRRKALQLQKSFLIWFHFLPLHHTISKTLSKIIEKVFLNLFGPSFSLAIYMTWVVPFLFTHELHIFKL